MPKRNNAILLLPPVLKKIQTEFLKKNKTLAVAESCTGGLLAYWLTSLPGSSQFFLGSIVSYSYVSKKESFGVSSQFLKQQGAVNERLCRLMAQSVKNLWKSHWSLSITGVAGPSRLDIDPPVGVVFIGLNGPNVNIVQKLHLKQPGRQKIRYTATLFALDFLYSSIKVGANLAGKSKNQLQKK